MGSFPLFENNCGYAQRAFACRKCPTLEGGGEALIGVWHRLALKREVGGDPCRSGWKQTRK